jgi:hypothetical protein
LDLMGLDVRSRRDLGDRKQWRVDYQRPGYIITAPDAPWLDCLICDVSDGGLRVDTSAPAVPEVFAVSFTSGGEVVRLCRRVWRRGRQIGARFITTQQLRGSEFPNAG